MKKILFRLSCAVVLTGCNTMAIKPETRSALDRQQNELRQSSVAILTDSCLSRAELGTSHIIGQESAQLALGFNEALAQQLKEVSVNTTVKSAPFICGFMPKKQIIGYDIRLHPKDKRQEINQFPVLNALNHTTPNLSQQDTLLRLFEKLNKTTVSPNQNTFQSVNLDLSAEDLSTLKTFTQANKMFVVNISGAQPSFGRKFSQATLSAGVSLATMGAGAGLIYYSMPVEGQRYALNLIDLSKNQIVWHQQNNFAGKLYKVEQVDFVAPNFLDPLFPATVAKK
ncbi:lipoprotein [Acinetobacter radioresistens]|uniref:lipoprotein n=1 Tax=Acinetobacter radioresistens TaxID=40216 RepID=UPI003D030963